MLAVARVFYFAGPPSYLSRVSEPLLRLLHTSKEVERVVLAYILVISRTSPVGPVSPLNISVADTFAQNLFAPFYPRFLLRTDDLRPVKQDKIRLLLRIVNPDSYQPILREFIVSSLLRTVYNISSTVDRTTQMIQMTKSSPSQSGQSADVLVSYRSALNNV